MADHDDPNPKVKDPRYSPTHPALSVTTTAGGSFSLPQPHLPPQAYHHHRQRV